MHISEYVTKNFPTQREAARKLEIDEATLSRYVRGAQLPQIPEAFRIKTITEGAVEMESWLRLPAAQQQSKNTLTAR